MQPYRPEPLPLSGLNWEPLVRLMGKANAALARHDGILQGIVNPELLLSPLTTQEAVLSSKIEGTQATLEDVLRFEATPDEKPERYEDIRAIINYRRAMTEAAGLLKKRPISLNMLKKQPILTSAEFVKRSGIPKDSAMRIFRAFQKSGHLVQFREGGGRRAAVLASPDLLFITEERKFV